MAALTEQPQQHKQKKKALYIIKKKARFNSWIPIALYDDNNNFRGQAVFEDHSTALKYMHKYQDRLIKSHLKESKHHVNDNQRHLNAAELKIFSETQIPDIRAFNR